MKLEDLERYLPTYLSREGTTRLFKDLKQFEIDQRLYTSYLRKEQYLFQGDGITGVMFIELPSKISKDIDVMILSNSCDINPDNRTFLPIHLSYAPIVSLDKYSNLLSKHEVDPKVLEQHVNSVKKQEVSNIFYLPTGPTIGESIVFFDRINSCDINYFSAKDFEKDRIFTLSDYGFFLFLYKLSIHFTRMREGIERRVD